MISALRGDCYRHGGHRAMVSSRKWLTETCIVHFVPGVLPALPKEFLR